jgi:hypothetical protein
VRSEPGVVGAFLIVTLFECACLGVRAAERGLSGVVCAEFSRDFAESACP